MSPRYIITLTEVAPDRSPKCLRHFFWCPGCDDIHSVVSTIPDVDPGKVAMWEWDGKDSFDPSILVTWNGDGEMKRCHSFIRSGKWQFLEDCTHRLAGKTVPLMPIPDDFQIN